MDIEVASSSDEGGHPRKRRKQGNERDGPRQGQAQRDGIQARDGANMNLHNVSFGGTHLNYYGTSPIGDSATSSSEALIKSLSFPTMNRRRDYISEECPETCKWLLDTNEWKQWRQSFEVAECPRLLWINGHAGSGKSTIMKYAYGHAWRHKSDSKEIVLGHFFNARAKEKIDKSTEGMYRTILVQLLEALQATNVPGEVARRALGGQVVWHVETLLELFRDILRGYVDRPVTCFVDALDECDVGQVRDMIRSFRDLMEKEGKGVRVQLRVLFSSRHYPKISTPPPDKAICMALEDQPGHARDITNYIESYLWVHDSPIAQEVKIGVREKARGSFIWCKLVIDLLNKDNDDAKLDRPLYLRERLAAIPPELDVLFAEILGMSGKGRVSDHEETVLCMQWVLFSMWELTPHELWWAIQRGLEPQGDLTELVARCRPEYLKRYILRVSRGLVETVEHTRGGQTVQVVHESVRDFLLGHRKMAKLMGLEVCEEEAVARSHEHMKRICWDELFVRGAKIGIPKAVLEDNLSAETDELRGKLAGKLPLLPYATRHMVKHANAAQRCCGVTSMDQQQFLEDLENRRNEFNILQIAFNAQFRDEFSRDVNADLTEILLHANAEALIERQHRRLKDAGVATHRFGLEFFGVGRAVWEGGCEEAVEAVVDVHLRRHSRGDPRRELLLSIAPEPSLQRDTRELDFLDPLFDLASVNPRLGLFFLLAALPVTHAATKLLATQPQSILGHFNALFLCVLTNPLQFENFQDSLDLEEALRWAADQGDVVVARILLDEFHVGINSSPGNRGTPLHHAARQGRETMVEFLLARDGVQPDLRDDSDETPLHVASEISFFSSDSTGDVEIVACGIVRRLLATGKVDVNARTSMGNSPLHYAVRGEGGKVVEVLLAAPGIDVDARNSDGKTPLQIISAMSRGSPAIAKMLLDTGKVDLNAQTNDGKTPRDLALE